MKPNTGVIPPATLEPMPEPQRHLIATIIAASNYISNWAALPDTLADLPADNPRRVLAKRRIEDCREKRRWWVHMAASHFLLVGHPSCVALRALLPLLLTSDVDGQTALDEFLVEAGAADIGALTSMQRWELLAIAIEVESCGETGLFNDERELMSHFAEENQDAPGPPGPLDSLTIEDQGCITDIVGRVSNLENFERPDLPDMIKALPADDPRRILAEQRINSDDTRGVGPAMPCASLLLLLGFPSVQLLRVVLPLLYTFEHRDHQLDFYQAMVGTDSIEAPHAGAALGASRARNRGRAWAGEHRPQG